MINYLTLFVFVCLGAIAYYFSKPEVAPPKETLYLLVHQLGRPWLGRVAMFCFIAGPIWAGMNTAGEYSFGERVLMYAGYIIVLIIIQNVVLWMRQKRVQEHS